MSNSLKHLGKETHIILSKLFNSIQIDQKRKKEEISFRIKNVKNIAQTLNNFSIIFIKIK